MDENEDLEMENVLVCSVIGVLGEKGRVEQRTAMTTWEREDNVMVGMELPEGAKLVRKGLYKKGATCKSVRRTLF